MKHRKPVGGNVGLKPKGAELGADDLGEESREVSGLELLKDMLAERRPAAPIMRLMGMTFAEIAGFLDRTENEVLEQIQLLRQTEQWSTRSMSDGVNRPRTSSDARRRTLKLLTAHPNGCTEGLLAAENIPADVLTELVRSGLVVARNETLEEGAGSVVTTRVWITAAGELILAARM